MRSRATTILRAVGACALLSTAGVAEAAGGDRTPAKTDDRIDLPAGVRFTPGSASVNEAARQQLQAAFAAPDGGAFSALFGKTVVCGPGLWQWLRQAPRATSIGKHSSMMVPLAQPPSADSMQALEGRSYFDRAATRGFLRLFRAGLPADEQPLVRRPTRLEMALLWAMVPFDLEDPLFVVETGGHHLIVVLLGPNPTTIVWIDDLAGMAFPPDKGISLPAPPRYVARPASGPTAPAAAGTRARAGGGPPP